ncbi:MAG: hypothetical protein D6B28_08840 [Gammaproteobacteria bacterium]|nr:MAG: hypothetical protein D6B28_08840 [Gammaproteobacteria bacterium]
MGKKILLIIYMVFFASSIAAAQEIKSPSQIITFNMTYDGYPPFMICNKEEKTSCGIMYEVFTKIMGKLGYLVRTIHVPKKREIEFFISGKLDAHAMAKEWVENPEDYVFSAPILKARNLIFSNVNNPVKYRSIKDLLGKRAITNLGFVYPPLTKYFEEGAIKRFDAIGEKAMMRMVLYGRGDFAIVNEHVGRWLIKNNSWHNKFVISERDITNYDYRIMFTKKLEKVVTKFNQHLEIMKENGEIDEIISRYIN